MPRLVIEKGLDRGSTVAIPAKGTLFFGRDSSSAFVIRDTMASRVHCKIEAREDGCWISDLESLNGTRVNGGTLKEAHRLASGDLVTVGETHFSYLSDNDSSALAMGGQRMGGYRIIERVGRGGMGVVYKAEQVDLQRIVALKVISEEHTKDKEFVELFIHEARAAAKLNHPNIVQVYDVKRQGNSYYFSMEFVSGGSVQDLLARQRKMAPARAIQAMLDAARGLEYAHQKGIIHRDIKPDNLMISETGVIKIGDMGLARGLGEKVGPEEETSVIGTPHYIAPEQVLGKPADFRSDIYSLGATAYRILAGVTPHTAPSVRDLVNKKVREDPAPLHESNPEIPRELGLIVGRMMARDPQKRTQSMTEVIGDLEKLQPRTGEFEGARPAPEGVVGNRKLLLAALGLLILVTALAVSGFIFWRGDSSTDPNVNGRRDEKLAAQSLENWRLTELKRMDRESPGSIEDVIAGYKSVRDRYPGSGPASQADAWRADLEKLLRGLMAERALADKLEPADAAAYATFLQSFQAKKPDWAPVDSTISAYRAFASGPEHRDTSGAAQALRRAAHIEKWKQRVLEEKDRFDKALDAARDSMDAGRFKEAWSALMNYHQAARDSEMECEFARNRYRSLLYAFAAQDEAKNVITKAQSEWIDVERQARALLQAGNYEAAKAALDPVTQKSVDDVATKARTLRDDVEVEWATATRKKMEAEDSARAERARRSAAAFEEASQSARAFVVKLDFKGALARVKSLRDSGTVEDLNPRLGRRVMELERTVHLKESLINVINAAGNPHGFKRTFPAVEGGQIVSADEKGIRISLLAGGTLDHLWTQMDGPRFYDFLKQHWKYSREQQNRDAEELCDLVIVCMEFGLYEEAGHELEIIRGTRHYNTKEEIRKFYDEYGRRLDSGESAEHDEIEVKKRLARLDAFMKAGDLPAAVGEIEVLLDRFKPSRGYKEAEARIGEYGVRIRKEGTDEDRKRLKDAAAPQ